MEALEDKLYINLFKGVYNVCSYPVGNAQEYIRTDAFIEKACQWLYDNLHWADSSDFLEDFKNYMKGE